MKRKEKKIKGSTHRCSGRSASSSTSARLALDRLQRAVRCQNKLKQHRHTTDLTKSEIKVSNKRNVNTKQGEIKKLRQTCSGFGLGD